MCTLYEKLSGIIPALVTPLLVTPVEPSQSQQCETLAAHGTCTHSPDLPAFSNFTKRMLQLGASGVVVAGSTGEGSLLSDNDVFTLITAAAGVTPQNRLFAAGLSGNSLSAMLVKGQSMIAAAAQAGRALDAFLVAPIPYIKLTQSGIFNLYQELYSQLNLPIIAYNVPSRTSVTIQNVTLLKLVEQRLIVAIKDATGSISQLTELCSGVDQLARGEVSVLCGDDDALVAGHAAGARGTISASANLLLKQFLLSWQAFSAGDLVAANEHYRPCLPVIKLLFSESNPVPLKEILRYLELIPSSRVVPPLASCTPETREQLVKAISKLIN